ncbi:DHA2 family efflux MFS transporter permease subunit [Zhihengliuella halotolerans]|uniref:DHA2 family efflux MFS transporter permease subunit n=1 Tax=Zhihengliuella halotolerans TaxID=370736 RepID=UPI002155F467|nr:DHA2 family efflux MFS transporter permease subunit [Zhihengliuella halotolerans]
MAGPTTTAEPEDRQAWAALWALVIGFFMILVDSTIVTTAMPAIMTGLDTGVSGVVWVHSSYLLAFVVPLLITGRMGDRFGPKNLYLIGLAVFTLASLWCGLATDLGSLVAARVAQGFGAAIMTPQSMTFITRLFPAHRRGAAMGIWGAAGGIAALTGPLLGGVLTDSLGWEWIFFVNVPIGAIAFWRVVAAVPALPTHARRFDIPGVVLSAVGIFLIVFGVQEAETFDWGPVIGWFGIWHMIVAGVLVMIAFVLVQRFTRTEPLLPLGLFADRNFALATSAIACMGLVITTLNIPIMFYLQSVRGLTPTQAALLIAPMALFGALLAKYAGARVNRRDPRGQSALGFFGFGVTIIAYGLLLPAQPPLLWLLLPAALMGASSAFVWPAVSLTATRDLGPANAGAGSGVYNATRQIGAVLGSAMMAVLIEARIAAHVDASGTQASTAGGLSDVMAGHVPELIRSATSWGLGEALLLPGAVALLGGALSLGFRRSAHHLESEPDVLDSRP